MALLLLTKEVDDIYHNPVPGVTIASHSFADVWQWTAVVTPAKGSPFGEARIIFEIAFPLMYPLEPPFISCEPNTVYHPNVVTETGHVSVSWLEGSWRPDGSMPMRDVLGRLRVLLRSPERANPVSPAIAKEWLESPDDYADKVKEHLKQSLLSLS